MCVQTYSLVEIFFNLEAFCDCTLMEFSWHCRYFIHFITLPFFLTHFMSDHNQHSNLIVLLWAGKISCMIVKFFRHEDFLLILLKLKIKSALWKLKEEILTFTHRIRLCTKWSFMWIIFCLCICVKRSILQTSSDLR